MKLAKGAEATLLKEKDIVIKERIVKKYRHSVLDARIRKFRTKREAKVMQKLLDVNVLVPEIKKVEDMKIFMEFIDGKLLKNCVTKELCFTLGEIIGKIHTLNIIHGDLTTSNMIVKNKKIYLIDFGLSFFSHKTEDKAVDLHVMEEAFKSTHYDSYTACWPEIVKGYMSYTDAEKVLKRLQTVKKRGRYKKKRQ
jgi:TP53 regulating kinase and related kinases